MCNWLSHELLYGIGRQDIKLNWPALYRKTSTELKAAINAAMLDDTISKFEDGVIEDFLRKLHQEIASHLLDQPANPDDINLEGLLALSLNLSTCCWCLGYITYASIFADDPGTSVLTFSALGMVYRSRGADDKKSTVVALWKDQIIGTRELSIEYEKHALVLSLCVNDAEEWTLDGRSDAKRTGVITFAGVEEIKVNPL